MNSALRSAFVGLAVLTFSACPEVPPPDPLSASPSVATFTASASQVSAGSSVTLSWKVENATSVRIDELSLGQVSGVSGNEGTVEVSVGADSTYVLTARNDRGAADTAVLSVRVSGAARELLLVAVPEQINAGHAATLGWTAPGATSVTLTGNPGGAVDVQGQTASGSVVVTPSTTTEYTLTAANGRTRTVTVAVAPVITSLTSATQSTDGGTSLTLSWTTIGAASLQLTGAGRGTLAGVTDAAQVAAGSFTETLPTEVDPGQYFSYTLTATTGSTSVTRTVIYAVPGNPAIVSFTGPEAAFHGDGGTVALAWQTLEADAVSVLADGVEIYRAPADKLASGSAAFPTPATDVEYTLAATASRGGRAEATLEVDVVGTPTVALTATPQTVTAGDPVSLSWTGTHIRSVSIREAGYGSVFSASGMNDTGTATVTPNADATYVIEVSNGLGNTATAMAQISVTGSVALTTSETGALRQGQTIAVSAQVQGANVDIVGLPHAQVDVRAASTGFDDIEETGATLTFASSSVAATLASDFRMPFRGRVVGENIQVSHHGYLSFGPINGANSTARALPSPYLEDLVVAPFWFSMSSSVVRWQVKPQGASNVLIVQWNSSSAVVQAKLYASGQIDFEYATVPTTGTSAIGVTGHEEGQTIVAPAAVAGQGFTFFGPKPSPVSVPVWETGPILGHVTLSSGALLRVSTSVSDVVRPGELSINEVMYASTAGVNGQWAELRNARRTPIALDGWSFALPDGGSLPLTGTVPPRGVLVVGATTDPALNADAGVQVAVPGFDLGGVPSLILGRGGAASSLPLTGGSAGVAITGSTGPFLFSGSTPAGNQQCASTGTYGGLAQTGSPGTDNHCGFAYDLTRAPVGYFDISTVGTTLTTTSFDDVAFNVDFSSAPITFFGAPQSSGVVTTNGFVTFESTASTTAYLAATPATSTPNLLVAALAGDLSSSSTLGGKVSVFRAAQDVDPFAAAPHWLIQWTHYYRLSCSAADLNFQIKLFDDGVIELHYDAMRSTSSSQCAIDGLTTTSTWLENAAGTQALAVTARSATHTIRPNTAFRYSPR